MCVFSPSQYPPSPSIFFFPSSSDIEYRSDKQQRRLSEQVLVWEKYSNPLYPRYVRWFPLRKPNCVSFLLPKWYCFICQLVNCVTLNPPRAFGYNTTPPCGIFVKIIWKLIVIFPQNLSSYSILYIMKVFGDFSFVQSFRSWNLAQVISSETICSQTTW